MEVVNAMKSDLCESLSPASMLPATLRKKSSGTCACSARGAANSVSSQRTKLVLIQI